MDTSTTVLAFGNMIAIILGWGVLVAGGAGVVIVLWWWLMEALWRMRTRTLNSLDLMDAARAWKRQHPEKFKQAARRNGWDEGDKPPREQTGDSQ